MPAVDGQGEVAQHFRQEFGLEHHTIGGVGALLRLKIRVTGDQQRRPDRPGAGPECRDPPGPEIRFAADIVRIGRQATVGGRVDLFEVRSPEALGIGSPQAQAVENVPGRCDLGLGHVSEVGIVLGPASDLEVQGPDQRDVHFGRDQRNRELDIGRGDRPVSLRVGVLADRDDIAQRDNAGHGVDVGIGPIEVGIAIVTLGFAARLDPEGDPDITCRQAEQVRA